MIRAVIFDYGGVVLKRLRLQKQLVAKADYLQKEGIRAAILSNMITPITFVFGRRSEFKHFDPVIISSQVGMSKPDPRIYELMLEKLGVPAEECLFIDNRADNVATAQQLGMKVIKARDTKQILEEIDNYLNKE